MTDGPVDAPTWRPRQSIRAVAIGIARSDGRILVVEVRDDDGNRKGWRPPGGGVEFMETAAGALRREIREELGCEVHIDGGPFVVENLYDHHGVSGHEIVFIYDVTLIDADIPLQGWLPIREDDGSAQRAEWVSLGDFAGRRETLFPTGLVEHL